MKVFMVLCAAIMATGCDFIKQDKCLDNGGRWNYDSHFANFPKSRVCLRLASSPNRKFNSMFPF